MSQNSEEIPRKDRAKHDLRCPVIPEAKGYGAKQQNFDVRSQSAERKDVGYGTPNFNVKKPQLGKRGESNE